MNKFEYYVEDILEELIDRSISKNNDTTSRDFNDGYKHAYNEVITYLINQADVFDIKKDLKDKMKNFIPPF